MQQKTSFQILFHWIRLKLKFSFLSLVCRAQFTLSLCRTLCHFYRLFALSLLFAKTCQLLTCSQPTQVFSSFFHLFSFVVVCNIFCSIIESHGDFRLPSSSRNLSISFLLTFLFLIFSFSSFRLTGRNTSKVRRRLFIRFVATDTRSNEHKQQQQQQYLSKSVDNVWSRCIRHTKVSHAFVKLRFATSMESNVTITKCAIRWGIRYTTVTSKYDAKQFDFIVADTRQSQLVFIKSFLIGKYARIRYSTTSAKSSASNHSARIAAIDELSVSKSSATIATATFQSTRYLRCAVVD